ncbi:MAG: hypothetical protein V4567_02890, partial [Pseudomonadota bacterium]
MRKHGKLATAIALALGGMICGNALAQTAATSLDAQASTPPAPTEAPPLLDWAIGLGAGHTDNINRAATDTTSQNILQPTLNFTFNKQGSTLQAEAVGAVQYVDYLE